MTPEFQYTFAFDVREAQDRDDLVVGPANAAAVAWIDRWPDWHPPGLVLIGPPAAGKSHLGAVWCHRSGAARHPAARLNSAIEAAREGSRALLIEDVDGATDEDNLFRLVNAMIEAPRPPARDLSTSPGRNWACACPTSCLGFAPCNRSFWANRTMSCSAA